MDLRIKTSLLVFLLLIPISSDSFHIDLVEGFKDSIHLTHLLYKDGFRMNSRKLLALDAVLDYDDAGANSRHDPSPKKKPGRNP
ncbi:putative Adenosylcobalamin-dependent ribonucleoside-triphosphate reductase [Quillaja saponaria]|uniref:Adenosylcobalamin-dependent ribonucleoside-triphosphate reductase n=1 Tax=Quillaja saponaria TaxID=32244 RepID=A0AAD7PLP9_QUISA|nr:putative Adenosylcobalamin-dependent ribonucleoside-triphosphate reductase [Quillaja saponaria]